MKSKEKNYQFYILNIKIRRLSSGKDVDTKEYISLFRKLIKSRIHKQSSPTKHCIIPFGFENKEDGTVKYFYGTLAQFTFIATKKWADLKVKDLETEFSIPDGLFPDKKLTEFIFIPSLHRFAYVFSPEFDANPYTIKRFMEFALDELLPKNRLIDVDVESDISTLERIISATVLKKIIIDVNYSNSDTTNKYQQLFDEDMKSGNVGKSHIEATQKKGETIQLTQSKFLYGAALSSLSNGDTVATIVDENGRTRKIETKSFPRKERIQGTAARLYDLMFDKIISLFTNGKQRAE